jgi:NADH-quinone oxidoreductase subunit C
VAESRRSSSHHTTDAAQPDFDKLSQPRKELLALAEEVFQDFHPQPGVLHDLPQLTVEPEDILRVCRLAKDEPRLDFKLLLCLTCVDYREHFQVVYFLHSIDCEQTLVIKTNLSYADPRLPSVTSVWQAADWYEREAHDLFGVVFEGHPNLAPLLLYEEFEGYPGRKEYPFYEYQEF